MKRSIIPVLLSVMLVLQVFVASSAEAACASVKIEILQELTLERVAFDAKMVITNSIPDKSLNDIRVDVVIKDKNGNAKHDMFFVRTPTLSGISAVDGTGYVPADSVGEAHWLIIPSPGAGIVTDENGAVQQIGADYWVGATLTYTIDGVQEVVPINPDKITVKPMPQLVLDYFMPYQVLGDNPFTPQVEAPVAYPLAVRVMNDGYGTANKLRIDSAQPKIIDNKLGLLINFKILGASVNDSAVLPSLTVDFGDLASKKAATASWQMISTLSGKFIEFKASFTHASELGGDLTSLIRETNAHYLTHMIKVNLPGRDSRLDFLADTDNDSGHLPESIYESEIPNGGTDMATAQSPVSVVYPSSAPARPTTETPSVSLNLPGGAAGWIYTKLDDPSQGMLKLLDVVRTDGVHLDLHNFWVDQGLDQNYKKTWTLQFVDYRADAATPGAYTLVFTKPDVDTTPPSTTLLFDGPSTGTNPAYVTPQTRMILSATDNDGGSGVDAMFKKVAGTDSDFVAAYPFNLDTPGSYSLEYYGVDRAGNVEAAKSANIVVVAAAPEISSFTATPTSFSPQAPKGVVAARMVDFNVTATSSVSSLPVKIAIASGSTFQPDHVVRTLKGTAAAGAELHLGWDGKDNGGKFLPTGVYSAQAKVSDGLDNPADANAPAHTATADKTITITDWFKSLPLDPNPDADQMHPRISGTRAVWQDYRGGKWDIYMKDLGTGASTLIPGTSPDRERPAVDGSIIVWQDYRNGNWDIFGYDLSTSAEFPICTEQGDQTLPVVSGNWIAWQDNRGGNEDIYAYNFETKETVQITSHERDQIHPAISGTTVAWEDYRHGLGEIYQYDLTSRTETRAAFGDQTKILPSVSGSTLVWSDRAGGQYDIYLKDATRGALRLTYGTGDHSQPALLDDLLVYTDYETGTDDPNLSFRLLSSGEGERLVSDPARQEEPAVGDKVVIWQDTRDGKYQVYYAPFETEALPVEAVLKPGFNLVAVGGWLAGQYPSASALITAKGDELGIERMALQEPLHNTYTEASAAGGDFTLAKGAGLVIYVNKPGTLKLAESGETSSYTLLPGTNQIGVLTVPFGYSAYDLMTSLGLDNVQSVRRFDNTTGAWQTVAVRTAGNGNGLIGANFTIRSGDGLAITMKNRVDGWMP
jgi:beta propeller repeat protein